MTVDTASCPALPNEFAEALAKMLADATAEHAIVRLPLANPNTGYAIRAFAEQCLKGWRLDELVDAVLWTLMEYLQNVIRHTDSHVVEVHVHGYPKALLAQVIDFGRAVTYEPEDKLDGSKVGMGIINAMATQAWRYRNHNTPGETRVALFEL